MPWLAAALAVGLLKALLPLALGHFQNAFISAYVIASNLTDLLGYFVLGFYIYKAAQFRTRLNTPNQFSVAALFAWAIAILALININYLAPVIFGVSGMIYYGRTA